MRKFIVAITILLAVAFLSSCLPETPDPPEGIWISDNPRIILYFKPEYRNMPRQMGISYLGIYTAANGHEIRFLIRLGKGPRLTFYDLSYLDWGVNSSISRGYFLSGGWQMRGEYLVFSPSGRNSITFRRAYDYEPIDLTEWFPDYFYENYYEGTRIPPEGVWFSRSPRIVLYITPDHRNVPIRNGTFSYLGIYRFAFDETRLIAVFSPPNVFAFYDIDALCENGFVVLGSVQVMSGVLRASTRDGFVLETEQGNIGFIRQHPENYEPIDLAEWFPDLIHEGDGNNKQP